MDLNIKEEEVRQDEKAFEQKSSFAGGSLLGEP